MKWFRRDNHTDIPNEVLDRLHVVRSEQVEDTFYWYDADSDEFIAQGQTDEEIRAVLRHRWADHIFVISNQHMLVGPDFDHAIDFNTAKESQ